MKAIAFFPEGLESKGADELSNLGVTNVKVSRRTVSFEGDLACYYRLHLRSRLAFRVLREIASFECRGPEDLYWNVREAIDWERWLDPSNSFRVDVTGTSPGLTHSHFTALQVKNALVDRQKEIWGQRSSVNIKQPDFCLHLHLYQGNGFLSLDGSGVSLHRRGYRAAMGLAPLKENFAAGLLQASSWNSSYPLVDPLCGSGTFLIEAASLVYNLAPGIGRSFLFERWPDFDSLLFEQEKKLARQQEKFDNYMPPIIGCEQDPKVANEAELNIKTAGFQDLIDIQVGHFRELQLPNKPGFFVCNPPYGKRLGYEDELILLYQELGQFLKDKASGWELWLLSGNPRLSRFLKMKARKRMQVSNGGVDCRWLNYLIN